MEQTTSSSVATSSCTCPRVAEVSIEVCEAKCERCVESRGMNRGERSFAQHFAKSLALE